MRREIPPYRMLCTLLRAPRSAGSRNGGGYSSNHFDIIIFDVVTPFRVARHSLDTQNTCESPQLSNGFVLRRSPARHMRLGGAYCRRRRQKSNCVPEKRRCTSLALRRSYKLILFADNKRIYCLIRERVRVCVRLRWILLLPINGRSVAANDE